MRGSQQSDWWLKVHRNTQQLMGETIQRVCSLKGWLLTPDWWLSIVGLMAQFKGDLVHIGAVIQSRSTE